MIIYSQLLGDHEFAVNCCMQIFLDGMKILINAPENTQRLSMTNKLHLGKVNLILINDLKIENVGGLIGLILSNFSSPGDNVNSINHTDRKLKKKKFSLAMKNITKPDCKKLSSPDSIPKMSTHFFSNPLLSPNIPTIDEEDNILHDSINSTTQLYIIGPSLLIDYLKSADSTFAHLTGLDLRVIQIEQKINFSIPNIGFEFEIFPMSIPRKVLFEPSKTDFDDIRTKKKMKLNDYSKSHCSEDVLHKNYLIMTFKCPKNLGTFDPVKAKELKIPQGKLYKELKNGVTVTLEDGRIIQSKEVCGESSDGKIFLILPDFGESFDEIHTIVDSLKIYLEECMIRKISYIFHFTDIKLIRTQEYSRLLDLFDQSSVVNIFCNRTSEALMSTFHRRSSSLENFLSNSIPHVYCMNHRCNFCPFFFKDSKPIKCEENFDTKYHLESMYPLQKLFMSPPNDRNEFYPPFPYDNNECIGDENPIFSDNLDYKELSNFLEELDDSFENINKFDSVQKESFDIDKFVEEEIIILGSGAAMPSSNRNVSGIILHLQHSSMILDFGEGSISQLYSLCSSWFQFVYIIKSIRIVFISHSHADHHLGILFLLKLRALIDSESEPLIIIGPSMLKRWLDFFNKKIDSIPHNYIISSSLNSLHCDYDSANPSTSARNFYPGLESIETFPVDHINESFGIKISTMGRLGNLVYSGDTRPCENLIRAAANCTILIHEATFDDKNMTDAITKGHSTLGEVFKLAENCNPDYLILTHFSQRYPRHGHSNSVSWNPESIDSGNVDHTMQHLCVTDLMRIRITLLPKLCKFYSRLTRLLS